MTCPLKTITKVNGYTIKKPCTGTIVPRGGYPQSPDGYLECLDCGCTWSDGREP